MTCPPLRSHCSRQSLSVEAYLDEDRALWGPLVSKGGESFSDFGQVIDHSAVQLDPGMEEENPVVSAHPESERGLEAATSQDPGQCQRPYQAVLLPREDVGNAIDKGRYPTRLECADGVVGLGRRLNIGNESLVSTRTQPPADHDHPSQYRTDSPPFDGVERVPASNCIQHETGTD